MGQGRTHHDQNHAHDPEAERRALVAATSVVGLLLGAHLVVGALGTGYERPWGVPLALVAAVNNQVLCSRNSLVSPELPELHCRF
jgi:hypothetical protein